MNNNILFFLKKRSDVHVYSSIVPEMIADRFGRDALELYETDLFVSSIFSLYLGQSALYVGWLVGPFSSILMIVCTSLPNFTTEL